MADHDQHCPWHDARRPSDCRCALIARVRADERATAVDDLTDLGVYLVRREALADLRANVEALPERGIGDVVTKRDVLALIDEATP